VLGIDRGEDLADRRALGLDARLPASAARSCVGSLTVTPIRPAPRARAGLGLDLSTNASKDAGISWR
jgi:hypothetical protein